MNPAGNGAVALAVMSLLCTGPVEGQARQGPRNLLGDLDAYVRESMSEWQVPGLSLAVVKDDRVVHARGYGTRVLGEDLPVDEETVFAIGSASKAFTTASIGMLVDEGRADWDAPVTRYLSWFRMHDPWVTREITVRDLVTHRSGLPGGRGNMLWYGSSYDRREIVRRIRYLTPTASFRAEYQYQNLMFLTAGVLLEEIVGGSWDAFVTERILEPLGMSRSVTSVEPLAAMENVASPHARIDGAWTPVKWRNVDNVAPAGSINSSARDMAQWIRLHLGEGAVDGRRLLSKEMALEMRTPQFIVDPDRAGSMNVMNRAGAGINFFTYGLGWQVFDYRGRKVMWHGGNIDGMAAVVAMVPDEELGLVVLTNRNGGTLRDAIMLRVFDAFLDAPPRDWSRDFLEVEEELARRGGAAAERASETVLPMPRAVGEYAGSFEDTLLGGATVVADGESLTLELETGLVAQLRHRSGNVFELAFDDAGLRATFGALHGASAVFAPGADGAIGGVSIDGLGEFRRIRGTGPR